MDPRVILVTPSCSSGPGASVLVLGGLAGPVAALGVTTLMLALRDLLGLPTPSEMVGDRLTAFITIQRFFELLDHFGGYEGLKEAGRGGLILGQIAVGVLASVAYAAYLRTRWRGWPFVVGIVGLFWLLSVLLLWPNLDTNYRGLPAEQARVAGRSKTGGA